jgi:hypothetical protein
VRAVSKRSLVFGVDCVEVGSFGSCQTASYEIYVVHLEDVVQRSIF